MCRRSRYRRFVLQIKHWTVLTWCTFVFVGCLALMTWLVNKKQVERVRREKSTAETSAVLQTSSTSLRLRPLPSNNLVCDDDALFDLVKPPTFFLISQQDGHLKRPHKFLNMRGILNSLGWCETFRQTDNFSLLWSWGTPFVKMTHTLHNLGPNQIVDKVPGTGVMTKKFTLSTMGLPILPRAFKLPADIEKLRAYAQDHRRSMFVLKNKDHRGIRIVNALDPALNETKTDFVQEFVQNPLLVDGRKFDVGVYAIITSADPLRIYTLNEVQLRFCPKPYHPFDEADFDKYVVSKSYLPLWEIEGLKGTFPMLTRKEALTIYLEGRGRREARQIWRKMDDAIGDLVLSVQPHLLQKAVEFRHPQNFFELIRFDFLIDDELNVILLEANMTPFTEATEGELQRLHKQVLIATLQLAGIARIKQARDFQGNTTGLVPSRCLYHDHKCALDCSVRECWLCPPCLSNDGMAMLTKAYWEHVERGNTHRIFPQPVISNGRGPIQELPIREWEVPRKRDRMMSDWFWEMCQRDASWCQ